MKIKKIKFWKNIALSLTVFLVSIGFAELFVRNFIPVRNVGPSFTTYDPIYGKKLKKDFSAQRITPEFTMQISTNSSGFRGPEIGTLSSRPILFIGDSFTMGYGVNDDEEFPSLVRKALKDRTPSIAPVINVGMGDNGNGRWIKFLRSEGKTYNPSLIILQIHANDFQDNIRERLFELDSTNQLLELSIPPKGIKRKIQSIIESVPGLEYSYLIGLTRQISLPQNLLRQSHASEDAIDYSGYSSAEDKLFFRLLQEVLSICKAEKWPTLAVLVDLPEDRLFKVENFLSSKDVLAIDIPGRAQLPDLYYQIDGHWNASGHQLAAKEILEILEQEYFQH